MTCGWKGNRRLVDSHDHRTVGLEPVFSAAVSPCSWEGNSRSGHVRDVQAVMSCAWEGNRRSAGYASRTSVVDLVLRYGDEHTG